MKTAIEMTREYARQVYFPMLGEFEIEERNGRISLIFSAPQRPGCMEIVRNELTDVYRKFQQVIDKMPGKAAQMLCQEKEKKQ